MGSIVPGEKKFNCLSFVELKISRRQNWRTENLNNPSKVGDSVRVSYYSSDRRCVVVVGEECQQARGSAFDPEW